MKALRIEILKTVHTKIGTLTPGQIFTAEALDVGSNYVKVKLPFGCTKTLFNFEANWTKNP